MKRFLTVQSLLAQVVRYGAVGGIVYALDMGVFVLFTFVWPPNYLAANVLAKLVGAASGFVLHKYVSFSWAQRDRTDRQLFFYVVLLLGNMILATALLYVGADMLELPEVVAKILADVIVITTSFFLGRHFVFQAAR